ncbi:hypothetical protein BC629DRAFT_1302168 [Irpex lacteus]|nr:hypothetical protein BC629DRAFT_1302168 [Irpex lacteus]
MQLDSHNGQPSSSTTTAPTKKRKPRDPQSNAPVHTSGKSVFPVSRVQKILKADKELPQVSREAVLLISLATEEFVKRLAEASHRLAVRESRLTVQRKDVASICRRAEEFFFLEELIPLYETEPTTGTGKRKPKALQSKDKATDDGKTRTLDRFAFKPKASASAGAEGADVDEAGGGGDDLEDVVMNDDGTMTLDSL